MNRELNFIKFTFKLEQINFLQYRSECLTAHSLALVNDRPSPPLDSIPADLLLSRQVKIPRFRCRTAILRKEV